MLRSENADLQQGVRALKEELAERDGQLRLAKMNLDTAQKQNQSHMAEVARYEETLAALHTSLEKAQAQGTRTHDQLVESQQVSRCMESRVRRLRLIVMVSPFRCLMI